MPLPKKIKKCPIVEAVFETRFKTDTPEDAIAGVVYHTLKSHMSKMTTLPFASVPTQFRNANHQFKHSPTHRLDGDAFGALVGPSNVAFLIKGDYPGWDDFSSKVLELFRLLTSEGLIKSLDRFGLRYINFFEGDVIPKLTVSLNIAGSEQHGEGTFLKTVLPKNDFKCVLQVGRDLKLANRGGQPGSIIDIDVCLEQIPVSDEDFNSQAERFLDAAHQVEKDLFFSLLKQDLLDSLEPIYQ